MTHVHDHRTLLNRACVKWADEICGKKPKTREIRALSISSCYCSYHPAVWAPILNARSLCYMQAVYSCYNITEWAEVGKCRPTVWIAARFLPSPYDSREAPRDMPYGRDPLADRSFCLALQHPHHTATTVVARFRIKAHRCNSHTPRGPTRPSPGPFPPLPPP